MTRIVQLGPAPFHKLPDTPRAAENLGVPPEVEKRLAELRAANAYEKSPREFCEAAWNVFKYTMVGNPASAAKFDLSFCALENEWPANFNAHGQRHFPTIAKVDLTKRLAEVKVPVLTIHGTKDRNAPHAGGVEWAKSLPDARLVSVEGAAHASWLDDPATVFGSIRHFLRGEWPLGS